MTTFAILMRSDTYASTSIVDCQRFITAATQLEHQIDHVFLYENAVLAALAQPDLPSDEMDLAGELAKLCSSLNIPLIYCSTAAEKRGILQPRDGYTLAGLAEFGMRLAAVDKLIQF